MTKNDFTGEFDLNNEGVELNFDELKGYDNEEDEEDEDGNAFFDEAESDNEVGEDEVDDFDEFNDEADDETETARYEDEPTTAQLEMGTIKNETVAVSANKLLAMKNMAERLKSDLAELTEMIAAMASETPNVVLRTVPIIEKQSASGKIIEGVFDGEKMIGADGEIYKVPTNYASKSKMVEGDILKLTITEQGAFIFKQIGPIERARIVTMIAEDEVGNFWAIADNGKKWRILTASVTYFKGEPGDEATILVPKDGQSRWAAVEHIVHTGANK